MTDADAIKKENLCHVCAEGVPAQALVKAGHIWPCGGCGRRAAAGAVLTINSVGEPVWRSQGDRPIGWIAAQKAT